MVARVASKALLRNGCLLKYVAGVDNTTASRMKSVHTAGAGLELSNDAIPEHYSAASKAFGFLWRGARPKCTSCCMLLRFCARGRLAEAMRMSCAHRKIRVSAHKKHVIQLTIY
jgi:hypothetical protein